MKKLFTLLTLLVAMVTSAWADATVYATYTVSLNDGATVTPAESTFFTVSSGGGYNAKYTGKYGGVTYTKGLKLNSSSSITFTTTVKSNITVVQSTAANGTKTFKLGGAEVAHAATGKIKIGETDVNYAMTENTTDTYKEFVFTDVPATTSLAFTHSGETGILFVKVELTEDPSAITKLDTPVISYTAATGEVTIGSVTNATKVTYTTDGTAPTASSDTYTAPFVVDDGTVVNAIAIGDGSSYSNSDVATETVYLTGITVATPVIKKFNGAVAITSTTPNATIKYSTDGGSTYNDYARPFTLTADATVQAYATRTGCTDSGEASADVTVVKNIKTKTVYLDFDDFDISTYTATGKADTDAEGYVLTIGNMDKSWSSNGVNITTPAGVKKEFKLSNGAQNTLTIPDGVTVSKLTLYSVIMSADHSLVCGWREVNGGDYQTGDNDYKNVPMGAYNDVTDWNTNPDVRVYALDQTGGSVTFTNAGYQLSFVAALDIVEYTTVDVTIAASGYSSFSNAADLDFTAVTNASSLTDFKAYVASAANGSAVTLTQVDEAPAATGLIIQGTGGETYTIPVKAGATLTKTNKLVAAVTATAISDACVLKDGNFHPVEAGTIPAGKAYLPYANIEGGNPFASGARELAIVFGDDATGIDSVTRNALTNGKVYNLQGQEVKNATKGIFIVNGKKVILK